MKKVLSFILVALCIGVNNAEAQTSFSPATGTVTDSGSDTLDVSIPGYQAVVGIQFVATKGSGTVAGTARFTALLTAQTMWLPVTH